MSLNPKQARFVDEYLVDLNATQAALRAGYSKKTAYSQGQRLLKDAEIQKSVQEKQNERADRTGITADRVLLELARIGFSDLRNVFDEHGNLKPVQDLPIDVAGSIASVEVVRERTIKRGESVTEESVLKIKAWDKTRALDMLARHLGLLKDRVELSGSVQVDHELYGSVRAELDRLAARHAASGTGAADVAE